MTRVLSLIAAAVGAAFGFRVGRLFVSNSHLPSAFPHDSLGASVATGLIAVIGGAIGFLLLERFRRSPVFAVLVTLALAFIAWELYPRPCSNQTEDPADACTCEGWAVAYYPKGAPDAEETNYCLGLEEPVG